MVNKLRSTVILFFVIVFFAIILGYNSSVNANSAIPESNFIYFYVKNIPENAKVTLLIENGENILRKVYHFDGTVSSLLDYEYVDATVYDGNWYKVTDTEYSFRELEYNSKNKSAKYILSYDYGIIHNVKILVETDNGNIISDILNYKQYIQEKYGYNNSKNIVVFDCNTGIISTHIGFNVLLEYLLAMITTVIIELLIAILFKLKKYFKTIIITNILTQIILHTITFILFTFVLHYNFIILLLLEFIIWYLEYRIYIKYFENIEKTKIIKYVITANLISFILPMLIINFKSILINIHDFISDL